ncbi:metallopeptidase TldD-related protein [Candidatus Enterococcus ikei]|uniref:metallopeptidase TldD-related protein n=1 Tax=Candidatus Enterococcus ikei TaxID=2815326 RepID=UPI001F5C7FB5|nr:metallopeptidase TldD-related protein [Enterococcus sp. DIV0869a]
MESDNISILTVNDSVNCEFLSVTDDIKGNEHIVGLNKYDDNNVEIKRTELIKNGKIISLIDSNDGFFRTDSILKKTIPRMRVTYVENCKNFDYNCHEKYKNYVEISQIFGGGVDFRTGHYQLFVRGILYEDGIPTYRMENLLLSGNSQESLERIVFIGNDLKIVHAYCVKNNQMLDVGVGSPTIYIKKSGGI